MPGFIDNDGNRYYATVAEALRVVAGMLTPEQLVALAVTLEQHTATGENGREHIWREGNEVRIEIKTVRAGCCAVSGGGCLHQRTPRPSAVG
jgi:hypothetical protein